MVDTISEQAKTRAAEMAVKLNIMPKKNEQTEEVAAPAAPVEVAEKQPKLREKKPAEAVAQPDLASVVQKWGKK
jgi:hypothetical protein